MIIKICTLANLKSVDRPTTTLSQTVFQKAPGPSKNIIHIDRRTHVDIHDVEISHSIGSWHIDTMMMTCLQSTD